MPCPYKQLVFKSLQVPKPLIHEQQYWRAIAVKLIQFKASNAVAIRASTTFSLSWVNTCCKAA
jgi:hypothetical protein